MSELTGRTVLITGGSRGIGYATAAAFLAHGARVAISARDGTRLAAAAQALGAPFAQAADVRDWRAVEALVRAVEARLGPVEVLVNNAGVVWVGEFAAQEPAAIDALLDVNVKGVLYATRALLPGMLARGRGTIVNVASGVGLHGFPQLASYCASKFAVVGFTESLAAELEGSGVRVFGVCPGRVATDMQVQYSGAKVGLAPERVAERIVQLAGDSPGARPGQCVAMSE
jgi:3-oxoacyl-[acyl-carrier protein] reductase